MQSKSSHAAGSNSPAGEFSRQRSGTGAQRVEDRRRQIDSKRLPEGGSVANQCAGPPALSHVPRRTESSRAQWSFLKRWCAAGGPRSTRARSVLECGDRDARRKPASAAPLSWGVARCPSTALYLACESSNASAWCRALILFTPPSSLRKRRRA